ncbi:hypothetical protein JCM11251_005668 [Rhodosporidiobolus azoricus]
MISSLSQHSRPRRRKSRSRKRRRTAAAVSAPPDNTNLIIGIVVAVVILLIAGGGYWWWTSRDSTSSDSASSSGAGSTGGSAGTGAVGGGGTGGGGAATGGGAAGENGTARGSSAGAGTAGSGSGAGTSGASQGSGSKTASGTATGTATAAGSTATGSGGEEESTGGGGGGGKVAGFFENWRGQKVAYTKFDGYDIVYFFTAEFATAAKAAGCTAMLSVGGWTGSSTFSALMKDESKRGTFADNMIKAAEEYGFDGIDIDYEYPGKAGATNDFDASDLDNLLLLLQEMKEKKSDLLLAADTSSGPWVGSDGQPSTDLSKHGEVLDWILIMTYDSVTYSSKVTGPNFAFDAKCGPSTNKFDYPTAIGQWIDAKFPAEKILLGLVTYGYAWKVADFKEGGGVDGATSSIYQTVSEVLKDTEAHVDYDDVLLDSMEYTFDDCSSTPFLYSSTDQKFIAFDDEKSTKVKGAYAKGKGLYGCGLYAGLTQDKEGKLLQVAKEVC